MKVTLLDRSTFNEINVATAGRRCYSSRDINDIIDKFSVDDNSTETQVSKLRDAGHFSTFEHTFYMFHVEGISRAASHQLVRHRHLSFEQQSQRYTKVSVDSDDWYVVPSGLKPNQERAFRNAMLDIAREYTMLLDTGAESEDARAILPNACKTSIIVSGNARAFYEMLTLRTCEAAQTEIKQMGFEMLRQLKRLSPSLFHKAGATCVRGYCNEPNGPKCPRYINVTGRKTA